MLLVLDWRWRTRRHPRPLARAKASAAAVLLLGLSLQGCHTGPQPVAYGQDNCFFCKMTFADKRFGGEVCTRKGKVYKFDDLHCLLASLQAGTPAHEDIGAIYLVDFTGGGWIEAPKAYLLKAPGLHTPMGGDLAAFTSETALNQSNIDGQQLLWKDLYR
jgi:copper chaperone NosL